MSVSVEVRRLPKKEKKELSVRFSIYLQDFNWLMDNMDVLLEQYPNMYIAVRNKKVEFSDTTMQGIVENIKCSENNVGDFVIEFIPTEKVSYLL